MASQDEEAIVQEQKGLDIELYIQFAYSTIF